MFGELSGGRRRPYIAVTGAIGAGASTLAQVLRDELGWFYYEVEQAPDANPFFAEAYSNFKRWGFQSQVNFMTISVERHQKLRWLLAEDGPPIVEDRTPFEHCAGYLRAYVQSDSIERREADLLERLDRILRREYVTPDLLIFRRISDQQLVSRVRERKRIGEEAAKVDFLRAVEAAFESMVSEWERSEVLIIDADLDVLGTDGRDKVISGIRKHIDWR